MCDASAIQGIVLSCLRPPQLAPAIAMANLAPQQEIVDVKDPIVDILRRYEADELGIVKAADLLEQSLKKQGLLYDMVINPRQVGFDPVLLQTSATTIVPRPCDSSGCFHLSRRDGEAGVVHMDFCCRGVRSGPHHRLQAGFAPRG